MRSEQPKARAPTSAAPTKAVPTEAPTKAVPCPHITLLGTSTLAIHPWDFYVDDGAVTHVNGRALSLQSPTAILKQTDDGRLVPWNSINSGDPVPNTIPCVGGSLGKCVVGCSQHASAEATNEQCIHICQRSCLSQVRQRRPAGAIPGTYLLKFSLRSLPHEATTARLQQCPPATAVRTVIVADEAMPDWKLKKTARAAAHRHRHQADRRKATIQQQDNAGRALPPYFELFFRLKQQRGNVLLHLV